MFLPSIGPCDTAVPSKVLCCWCFLLRVCNIGTGLKRRGRQQRGHCNFSAADIYRSPDSVTYYREKSSAPWMGRYMCVLIFLVRYTDILCSDKSYLCGEMFSLLQIYTEYNNKQNECLGMRPNASRTITFGKTIHKNAVVLAFYFIQQNCTTMSARQNGY